MYMKRTIENMLIKGFAELSNPKSTNIDDNFFVWLDIKA